jgi:hypothetical protein
MQAEHDRLYNLALQATELRNQVERLREVTVEFPVLENELATLQEMQRNGREQTKQLQDLVSEERRNKLDEGYDNHHALCRI